MYIYIYVYIYIYKVRHELELAHAGQFPRPTKYKYYSKLAVITKYNLHQRELTAELGKDKQLIMCPNCN